MSIKAMGRRLFVQGLAAAPVVAGEAAKAVAAIDMSSGLAAAHLVDHDSPVAFSSSLVDDTWSETHPILGALNRRHNALSQDIRNSAAVALREAAGALDPGIQAMTSCSSVYRQHLQRQRDEAIRREANSLWDEISRLRKIVEEMR